MENTIKNIDNLNLRDFIRIYLHVNEVFKQRKDENAKNIHSAMYAVKNPEKVKELKQKSRAKLLARKQTV